MAIRQARLERVALIASGSSGQASTTEAELERKGAPHSLLHLRQGAASLARTAEPGDSRQFGGNPCPATSPGYSIRKGLVMTRDYHTGLVAKTGHGP